jgi:hypothetical protein
MTTSDEAMQSLLSEAAAVAYYNDLEFASRLCRDFAAQDERDPDISGPLRDAESTLKNILESSSVFALPHDVIKARISSALPQAIAAASNPSFGNEGVRLDILRDISRVQERLDRQPEWPLHSALIRFEATFKRQSRGAFSKKQRVSREFVLRAGRLYFSNGEKGHPDSREGSLAFMRENPKPDGKFCIELRYLGQEFASENHCAGRLKRRRRPCMPRNVALGVVLASHVIHVCAGCTCEKSEELEGEKYVFKIKEQRFVLSWKNEVIKLAKARLYTQRCHTPLRRSRFLLQPTQSHANTACASLKLRSKMCHVNALFPLS